MRITQGTFSFLPDLTDEQITAQLLYAIKHNWALSVEYTYDIHPRNAYWEMWGLPAFDTKPEDVDTVMREVRAAREAFPEAYIKVLAYDPTRGRQTSAMSFIVNRPTVERPFKVTRIQGPGRTNRFRYDIDEEAAAREAAAVAAASNGSKSSNGDSAEA
jgi:ribulose-bisphosphate carboxylase small chain